MTLKICQQLHDFENMSTLNTTGRQILYYMIPSPKLKYFIINIGQNSNFIPIFNFNFLKVMDIRIFR